MRAELLSMKEINIKRYCVLVYAMLKDGKVDTANIDKNTLEIVCASLETRMTVSEFQSINGTRKLLLTKHPRF